MKNALIGLALSSSLICGLVSAEENILVTAQKQQTPNPGNPNYSDVSINTGAYSPNMSAQEYAARQTALKKVCNDIKNSLKIDVSQCKSLVDYTESIDYAHNCGSQVLWGTYTFSMNYTSGAYLKLNLSLPPQQFTYGTCKGIINASATLARSECQSQSDRISQSACSSVN